MGGVGRLCMQSESRMLQMDVRKFRLRRSGHFRFMYALGL